MQTETLSKEEFIVSAIALTEIDGQPRARDVDLAERLGFDRPRKIREIIERNLSEIDAFGYAPRRRAHIDINKPNGGVEKREVTEYWLNEEQALLVSILSKAPNAPAVRAMLIRVFVAYRRGQLGGQQPNHDMMSAIEAMLERKVEERIRALLSVGFAMRRGRSAGYLWREFGFPPIKGVSVWFGNRLERMGCTFEPDSRGESSTSTFRLFDPDKTRVWLNNGGRFIVDQKIAERRGQGRLHLVGSLKTGSPSETDEARPV